MIFRPELTGRSIRQFAKAIDDLVTAYVSWREECGTLHGAYDRCDSQQAVTQPTPSGLILPRWSAKNRRGGVFAERQASLHHLRAP